MEDNPIFPVGKLPQPVLNRLLARLPMDDPQVLVKPGIGMDCAVIKLGETCLVFKSDPITFTAEDIGWYLVQVNANDIATTGAIPRWLLITLLLPEGKTGEATLLAIADQVGAACRQIGIVVIGGHTEVTYGLERPILVGTLVGEVSRANLVTPAGAHPGDRILLTKSVPIEATSILARQFAPRLAGTLTPAELEEAANYIHTPGISVLQDARLALGSGRVHAMHDPTEGGLAAALWELAAASQLRLVVNPDRVRVTSLSRKICAALEIDPLAAIASGALLLAVPAHDAENISSALSSAGISCEEIGWAEAGETEVRLAPEASQHAGEPLALPERDEIARLY